MNFSDTVKIIKSYLSSPSTGFAKKHADMSAVTVMQSNKLRDHMAKQMEDQIIMQTGVTPTLIGVPTSTPGKKIKISKHRKRKERRYGRGYDTRRVQQSSSTALQRTNPRWIAPQHFSGGLSDKPGSIIEYKPGHGIIRNTI